MKKEESRVLVYAVGHSYGVFATYRRNFIEELLIVKLPVLNEYKFLEENLRTFNEVTYVLPCCDFEYSPSALSGFKVFNGGDRLMHALTYCKMLKTVLCMLDRRGLINPPDVERIIELSDKCLL
ncbi:MAG: hypothetical protein QXE10_05215 [Desulfurococcaceae archaeon]|jgi:hypothetical protein